MSLRLGDHVPMIIMLHLLTNFVTAVEGELITKFIGQAKERKQSATEVSSDEADSDEEGGVLTAEMLLMEDGEISFKRENLHQKKKRLMVAERELKTFTSKRNKERPT